ncbi:MAG: CoA transferase, partial [Deltaproteobacteria bacterium]|nr:CoA transferase [Deltaproteobacteria bacterium]
MAPVLEGIKVIDVSQVAAVPMAARILADFGADVIHVENPTIGDHFRHVLSGMSSTTGIKCDINYVWELYNRNKKCITLDLSQEGGQEVLYKIIETADVFLTNLRPFELKKFRVEYETLNRKNPRLVAGYLTGYGKSGADKNVPAYDHTAYWARSGIPHRLRSLLPALREPGVTPPAFLPAFGDHMAGMSLACGIMMALFGRERTGSGEEVNVSLFHSGVYQLSFDVSGALVTGEDCPQVNSREDNPNALVGQYQTKDGRWILFCILRPERFTSQFCKAIGREKLLDDPRFESMEAMTENRIALMEILDGVFKEKTLDEWKPLLNEAGLPWSPIQSLLDVVHDPQARANDFFVAYDHPTYGKIEGVANPIKLGKGLEPVRMP